jgi:uncharacterized protein DUF2568
LSSNYEALLSNDKNRKIIYDNFMSGIRTSNLILAFLLELAMLAAYCYGGFHLQTVISLRVIVGIGIPVLTLFIWNHYLAPRAAHRFTLFWLIITKIIIFSGAVLILFVVGKNEVAIILGLITFLNLILTVTFHQT